MTLILSRSDLIGLVEPDEVVALIEEAHADLARSEAVLATPQAMPLDGTDRNFIPMAAVLGRHRVAGIKLLADMPSHRERGLSAQRSTVLVTSTDDGSCEAIVDGRHPTLLRTAATSAVATRHLAPAGAQTLGIVGAGALAIEHVKAIGLVRPLRRVLVWSRSAETVRRFVEQTSHLGVEVVPRPSAADVVAESEILCTLTPSREPVVEGAWMNAGLHVNLVGAPPRPDHREIDSVGIKRSLVVVDSVRTIHETGDLVIPLREGALRPEDLSVELGQVITGAHPGRTADDQITAFKSVGIGLQDLAVCRLLVERAREAGRGRQVDLTA